MSQPARALAVLWLGLLAIAGCGPTGASVSGKVTLNGVPLDEANISFVPQSEGQQQAGWATIQGGRYAIAQESGLGTGAFRVEIRALRPTGEKSNDPSMVSAREIIPARYNVQSELKAEIVPGENSKDFDLKSK